MVNWSLQISDGAFISGNISASGDIHSDGRIFEKEYKCHRSRYNSFRRII